MFTSEPGATKASGDTDEIDSDFTTWPFSLLVDLEEKYLTPLHDCLELTA